MGKRFRRRFFLKGAAGLAAGISLPGLLAASGRQRVMTRSIRTTGAILPVIGLGTWLTFDVTSDEAMDRRYQVWRRFFELGGLRRRSLSKAAGCLRAVSYPRDRWSWKRSTDNGRTSSAMMFTFPSSRRRVP